MGGFRSQPLTTKDTQFKECPSFNYAVTSMCGTRSLYAGWRQYMEDAHICAQLSDKKSFLFAVFDGHGGNASLTQARRSLLLWSGISWRSWSATRTSRIRITSWR